MRQTLRFGAALAIVLVSQLAYADELYVSNFQNGTISKVDTATGAVTPFVSGLVNPSGVAFNSSGDLFVAIRSAYVAKITPDGTVTQFGPSYSNYIMAGAAVDADGNVYASGIHPAGTFIASIFKLSPTGSLLSTWSWSVGNGPLQPTGMAIDAAGNVFTADYSGNKLWKIAPDGTASLITQIFVNPQGVVLDGQGELFVSLTSSGAIAKVTQAGAMTTFASSLSGPAGISFDSLGNLFVATGTTLTKLKPDGSLADPIPGLHSAQYIANRTLAIPEPTTQLSAATMLLLPLRRRRAASRGRTNPCAAASMPAPAPMARTSFTTPGTAWSSTPSTARLSTTTIPGRMPTMRWEGGSSTARTRARWASLQPIVAMISTTRSSGRSSRSGMSSPTWAEAPTSAPARPDTRAS